MLLFGCALYRRYIIEPLWLDAYLLYLPGVAFLIPFVLIAGCSRKTRMSLVRLVIAVLLLLGWLFPVRFRSDEKAGSVRLVSLNIQAHKTDLNSATQALQSVNPDFVCLQEVWHRQELQKIETALGNYKILGAASDEFERRNFNEGTFVAVRDDWTIESSSLKEESALIKVSRKGQNLVVVSVHGPRNARLGPAATLQTAKEQADKSRELATELEPIQAPIVIAGDFNAPESGPALKVLGKRFHQAFHQAGSGFGLTFPSRFPLARIDHVLGTEQIQFSSYRTYDFGSDHLGLIINFTLD